MRDASPMTGDLVEFIGQHSEMLEGLSGLVEAVSDGHATVGVVDPESRAVIGRAVVPVSEIRTLWRDAERRPNVAP
jgi:hypothetical protein